MRTLFLLLALASTVSAQTGSDARPTTIEDPDLLFVAIGKEWDVLEAEMPLPDSGSVADGAGTIWWSAADDDVEWVQADVRSNRVVQLSIRPGEDVDTEDLADFARGLKSELGPAGPDGYYDAAGWSDFRRAVDQRVPSEIKIQVKMFVASRLLVIRLTPGSFI